LAGLKQQDSGTLLGAGILRKLAVELERFGELAMIFIE
jgi:hypothetical protein